MFISTAMHIDLSLTSSCWNAIHSWPIHTFTGLFTLLFQVLLTGINNPRVSFALRSDFRCPKNGPHLPKRISRPMLNLTIITSQNGPCRDLKSGTSASSSFISWWVTKRCKFKPWTRSALLLIKRLIARQNSMKRQGYPEFPLLWTVFGLGASFQESLALVSSSQPRKNPRLILERKQFLQWDHQTGCCIWEENGSQ